MGVGLVEAVDDMRMTNPASNEQLLSALSNHLADQKYDLKSLMRLILQSESYQRNSTPFAGNGPEKRFYSHYYPKRLMAEIALDAVSQVTGVPTTFAKYASGTRAIELPDAGVDSYFLKVVRPARPADHLHLRAHRPAERRPDAANGQWRHDQSEAAISRQSRGLADRAQSSGR